MGETYIAHALMLAVLSHSRLDAVVRETDFGVRARILNKGQRLCESVKQATLKRAVLVKPIRQP